LAQRGGAKRRVGPIRPTIGYFPFLQRGLKEYARGMFTSQMQLAAALDDWGFREVRGRKTSSQYIDKILGRYLKFYAGIIVNPWTGEDVAGLHVPMITQAEMYNIQLIRSGKRRVQKRGAHNPDFPLRKTVACAECGRMLTGSVSRGNGGRYFYYHCYSKTCGEYGKAIPKADLEAAFSRYLRRITPKQRVLDVIKAAIIDVWEENSLALKSRAERHAATLVNLSEKRARIQELLEDRAYSREEGRERLAEVKNQLIATQIALNEARIEQFDIEAAVTYAANFIGDLGRQWFDLAPELRPRFQKLIFPEGVRYSRLTEFGTVKLGLIFKLSQQNPGEIPPLVDSMRVGWNQFMAEILEWRALMRDEPSPLRVLLARLT
jgi:site-specific DNA recombinase